MVSSNVEKSEVTITMMSAAERNEKLLFRRSI